MRRDLSYRRNRATPINRRDGSPPSRRFPSAARHAPISVFVLVGALMRYSLWLAGIAALALPLVVQAQSTPMTPDETRFRDVYRELVETDTSATTGSCTALADKVERHLRDSGYGDADITRFAR